MIALASGFESYDMEKPENKLHFHEAGFDAYLTGYCFAKMYHKLHPHEVEKVRNSVNVMKSFKFLKFTAELDPNFKEVNVLVIVFHYPLGTHNLCFDREIKRKNQVICTY